MTHPSVNISVRVALGFMALRLVLFFINADFPYQEEIFLFLLLAAFPGLTIYAIWPRLEKKSFKDDALNSLRINLIFAVAMAIFIYAFYAFADTNYFPNMRDLIVAREFDANPDLDEADLRRGVEQFFSLRNFSILAVLFFMVMGVFYSVLLSVIKRLVIK
jgi:uncharacterized membrane protein